MYHLAIHRTLLQSHKQMLPVSFWPVRWIHGPVWWVCGARRILLVKILSHTAWGSPRILVLVLCITALALVSLLHPCQHIIIVRHECRNANLILHFAAIWSFSRKR